MRQRLVALLDQPVIIRTLPEDARWEPIKGTVFEVRDDAVDVLIGGTVMKTVRLGAIIDVTIDQFVARDMVLEAPPTDAEYAGVKRLLFEVEEAVYLRQPAGTVKERAARAAEAIRPVRGRHPGHEGVEQMLERAHFLATGRYDYEVEPAVTSGEVANHSYRWARERAHKLEEALRLRRPEDEVAGHVAALARYARRAAAKYPNHGELKGWLERAEAIRKKLSDGARRANQLEEPIGPV